MILKKMLGLSVSAMVLISGNVYSREFADIYTDCGLGAMIAPKNDAVAAVTNVTWDLGTTAVSSNASSEDTCNGGKEATASYIHQTYAALENDIAKGEGEHISALFDTMGCSADSRGQLTSALRTDFSGLLNTSTGAHGTGFERSEGLYNMITERVNNSFASSCSIG